MKIVNCFFGKSRGGIEVVTVQYAKAAQKSGYASEIFTLNGRNYTDYIRNSNIKCRYLMSRGFNPVTILHFILLLITSHPDIVFLHGTKAIEFGISLPVRLLFPRIKFVGVSHGILSKKYKPLKYLVAITNCLKTAAQNIKIPHCYLLYNTTAVADEMPKQETGEIVIGTCGRDSPVKGYDILLKALGQLKKRHLKFHCLFAGLTDDKYRALIDELDLSKHVTFLGWMNDKDAFYKQLDIYVSAAKLEPFGLTVIEAMMRGKPVIATDSDGPKEIITESCGLIIPKENPNAMADALQELITNSKKRHYLAKNGRIRALEEFSEMSLPEKFKIVVEDIASS